MRTVFITGATSGIGKALAEELISDHRLILCGRRAQRLANIKKELDKINEVFTLSFDIENHLAVKKAINSLPIKWKKIDILVNNAGNAHGLAPFDEGDMNDYEHMININLKGLIYISKAIIPYLKQCDQGHIVNISSIAGKEAYAKGNVYCATKAAVESLSKNMRIDLAPHHIKVTNIAPGAVETEFSLVRFKNDKEKATSVYAGFQPLMAQDVAHAIAFCVRQPRHVQIADMTIFPAAQYAASGIIKKT